MDQVTMLSEVLIETANDYNNYTREMSVRDFLRFRLNVWPLPDHNLDEENKYFNQVYVKVNSYLEALFNQLLTTGTGYQWTLQQLKQNLFVDLMNHTFILKTDTNLVVLATSHTGAALSIATKKGRAFNKYLLQNTLTMPLTVFRALSGEYRPQLHVGAHSQTQDIWSTSYDPIASLGFSLSNLDQHQHYLLRARLPAGFTGGLLVENTCGPDTVKEQQEFTLAAGIPFRVDDIFETELDVPDDAMEIKRVLVKVYDLSFS